MARAVASVAIAVIAVGVLVVAGEHCARPNIAPVAVAELRELEDRVPIGAPMRVEDSPAGHRHALDCAFAELAIAVEVSGRDQLGLYVPRARNVVQVVLDGRAIQTDVIGRWPGPIADQQPLLVPFPPLEPGPHRVEIAVACELATVAMWPVYVGPVAELRGASQWRHVWSTVIPSIALGAIALVVLACFVLPWPASERRAVRSFGWLLAWWAALCALYLGVDGVASSALRYAAFAGVQLGVVASLFRLVGQPPREHDRAIRVLTAAILGSGAAMVPFAMSNELSELARFVTYGLPLGGVLVAAGWLVRSIARGSRSQLDLAMLTALGCFAFDCAVTWLPWVPYSAYAPLGGLVLAVSFLAIVGHRMAARGTEIDEARTGERRRILEDMHDGLGSRLVGLLARTRREAVDPQTLARELEGGLDDLRLMVDSLEQPGGSLAEALGAYRGRIEPRCRAAGVTLVWSVPPDVDVGGLAGDTTLQIFRILQEAFSNAIRHGGAKTIEIRLARHGERVELRHRDDGKGFDVELVKRRGLATMAKRADRIGGELRIDSSPAGTSIALVFNRRE